MRRLRRLGAGVRGRDDERGAVAVVVAITMTLVLLMAALVVDVGALQARRAQLQDAADAAALAIAQRCFDDPTTVVSHCAAPVIAEAEATALALATETLNDGRVALDDLDFTSDTVTVALSSEQAGTFSIFAGIEQTDLTVSATARWEQPAIPLPLALNRCSLPEPDDDEIVFVGTGVYEGVNNLLDTALGGLGALLGSADVAAYLDGILSCGTNVLAGGWLDDLGPNCDYDPALLSTYVNSTLTKVLPPLNACTEMFESLVGKRVIVPVYDGALGETVGEVLGTVEITGYAEFVVTGWDFEGLLAIGDESYPTAPFYDDPSCPSSLDDLLGVPLTDGLNDLLELLLGSGLDDLLACQGIQGSLVDDSLTPTEAVERLSGVRLIA
jgi:Flp pilus assembly protein TadG